jgi:hypothetical protein
VNRRQFLQLSGLGSTAFLADLNLNHIQPSNAFLFLFLRGALIDMTTSALTQSAFAVAKSAWSRRTQSWYDNRLDAQLAQSKILDNRFARSATDIIVANVQAHEYNYIFATQLREELGYNVALCFSQVRDGKPSVSSFSGAASIGIAYAAKYLREKENLSFEEVQSAILPKYQDYDDWHSWSQPVSYTTYRTSASQNGVEIEYRAIDQRIGGYGIITVTINLYRQIEIPIYIKYT